jgi:hypothetical protein
MDLKDLAQEETKDQHSSTWLIVPYKPWACASNCGWDYGARLARRCIIPSAYRYNGANRNGSHDHYRMCMRKYNVCTGVCYSAAFLSYQAAIWDMSVLAMSIWTVCGSAATVISAKVRTTGSPIVLKILHGLVSDIAGVGSVPPWADVGSQMRTITEYAPADTHPECPPSRLLCSVDND